MISVTRAGDASRVVLRHDTVSRRDAYDARLYSRLAALPRCYDLERALSRPVVRLSSNPTIHGQPLNIVSSTTDPLTTKISIASSQMSRDKQIYLQHDIPL